jgi:peroxiredoxin
MSLLPEVENAIVEAVARAPRGARRRLPAGRGMRVAVLACMLSLVSATALAAVGAIDVPGLSPAPAADQPLRVLDADHTTTLASYRGGVLVVTFYASWCSPCLEQVRLVAEQRKELETAGKGTAVLIGYHERDEDARQMTLGHNLDLPVLQDPDQTVADAYGIQGIPATFVIDPEGRLVSTTTGLQTRASLAEDVRRAESSTEPNGEHSDSP